MYICVILIDDNYFVLNTPDDPAGIGSWLSAEDGEQFVDEYIGSEMEIAMEHGIAMIVPSFVEIDDVEDFIHKFYQSPPTQFSTTEMFFGGRKVNAMDIDQELGKAAWLSGHKARVH